MRKIFALVLFLLFAINADASQFFKMKFQAFDANGDPCSGCKLYTYQPSTTTNKVTYSDKDLTTPNTNPVVLDSRGEASVYLDGAYKMVLKTSADVTITTVDNILGQGDLDWTDMGDTPTSRTANSMYKVNSGGTAFEKIFDTAETTFAKGDLLVFSDSDTFARVPWGRTSQYLVPASGATTGLTWADLVVPEDVIAMGFEIEDVANDDASIVVNAGKLIHGTTIIKKTTDTTLTFATAADWYDGSTHSYAGGAGWCYVGVDVDGNIKLLHTNAPDYSDTDGNANGTLLYYKSGTTYWRVIGAVRVDTDNQAHAQGRIQQGNIVMLDVPQNVSTGTTTGAWTGPVSCTSVIPAISRIAHFMIWFDFNAGESNGAIGIRPDDTTYSTNAEDLIRLNNGNNGSDFTESFYSALDSSQEFDYYIQHAAAPVGVKIQVKGYVMDIR